MKLNILPDYTALSRLAAEIVITACREQPQIVLGLATGATPIGMYQQLVEAYQKGEVSFSQAMTFNLDEYYPIAADHPHSFRRFMQEHLFAQVDLAAERIHFLCGTATDVERECERYEAALEAVGGIDLQILGIGENGHIGFNEPGTPFHQKTHKVTLTEQTRRANARFFGSFADVPHHALTMGIRTIMRSRKIVLLASGEKKAEALAAALYGPVTEALPASVLQLHPDLTVIADEAAAARLPQAPRQV